MLAQTDAVKRLPPDARRTVCVRVADVPLEQRVSRARSWLERFEEDPLERVRVMALAHDPGDLVAWIAP